MLVFPVIHVGLISASHLSLVYKGQALFLNSGWQWCLFCFKWYLLEVKESLSHAQF